MSSTRIEVTITFETYTPESAEAGDFADHGFVGPGNWEYSIADDGFQTLVDRVGRKQALADMSPEPEVFTSIDDAVEFISHAGPFEPSCSPICKNGHCWVSQADSRDDYVTGASTRYSYHVKCESNKVQAEVIEALI